MPFEAGHAKVVDILTRRREELLDGTNRTWALETDVALSTQVDEDFSRTAENSAWSGLRANARSGVPFSAGCNLRGQVAWLTACARDLRTQYATGAGCRRRVPADLYAGGCVWYTNALRATDYFKKVNEG